MIECTCESPTENQVWHKGQPYCIVCIETRIAELEAVVEKLPKTADGVPVVPGADRVWIWSCGTAHRMMLNAWTGADQARLLPLDVVIGSHEPEYYDWADVYSTRTAAEAAKEGAGI